MMTVVSQTVSFFKVLFVHYLNDIDVDMNILKQDEMYVSKI